MLKNWLWPPLTIIAAYALYAALLVYFPSSDWFAWIIWIAPALAAILLVSHPLPRGLVYAILMAPVAGISAAIVNALFALSGRTVDFGGINGAITLFLLTAVMALPASVLGYFAGRAGRFLRARLTARR